MGNFVSQLRAWPVHMSHARVVVHVLLRDKKSNPRIKATQATGRPPPRGRQLGREPASAPQRLTSNSFVFPSRWRTRTHSAAQLFISRGRRLSGMVARPGGRDTRHDESREQQKWDRECQRNRGRAVSRLMQGRLHCSPDAVSAGA